jgi:restriction system protein
MAVPDFQSLMRPVLELLSDGRDHDVTSIRAALADRYSLSRDDTEQMLPGGTGKLFTNRVGWATTYLFQTKLIERPKRAVYRITDRGRAVLADNAERVDLKTLAQFEELEEFRGKGRRHRRADHEPPTPSPPGEDQTPEERIDAAYRESRSALAAELLDRVSEQTPEFFEQLVLDVLHAMEYGGSRDDAAERLGQSGDEGVDGVIREDRLGLDLIYVQAKHWRNSVGRPEIQKFFGALIGKRATKGVFITTSTFSRDAIEYADGVTPRIILIDGKELAELMIDHSVGVSVLRSYDLRRVDLDYFVGNDGAAES